MANGVYGAALRSLSSLEKAPKPNSKGVKLTDRSAGDDDTDVEEDGTDALAAGETPLNPAKKQPKKTKAVPEGRPNTTTVDPAVGGDAKLKRHIGAQFFAKGGRVKAPWEDNSKAPRVERSGKDGMVGKDSKEQAKRSPGRKISQRSYPEVDSPDLDHMEDVDSTGDDAGAEQYDTGRESGAIRGYKGMAKGGKVKKNGFDSGGPVDPDEPNFDTLNRDLPSASRGQMGGGAGAGEGDAADALFEAAIEAESKKALSGLLGKAGGIAAGMVFPSADAGGPGDEDQSPGISGPARAGGKMIAGENGLHNMPMKQAPTYLKDSNSPYERGMATKGAMNDFAEGGMAPRNPEDREAHLAKGFAHQLKRNFPSEMAEEYSCGGGTGSSRPAMRGQAMARGGRVRKRA